MEKNKGNNLTKTDVWNREQYLQLKRNVDSIKLDSIEDDVSNLVESYKPKDKVLEKTLNEISEKLLEVNQNTRPNIVEQIPFIGKFLGSKLKEFRIEALSDAKTLINRLNETLVDEEDKLFKSNKNLKEVYERLQQQVREKENVSLVKLKEVLNSIPAEIIGDNNKFDYAEEKYFCEDISRKIVDLEQSIVADKIVLATIQTLVKNNDELIVNVKRTKETSTQVVSTALLLEYHLFQQKKALELTSTINKNATTMLLSATEKLKSQGSEIHELGGKNVLNSKDLEKAVLNCIDAIAKITEIRNHRSIELEKSLKETKEIRKKISEYTSQKLVYDRDEFEK